MTIILSTLNLNIPYFALKPGPAEDVAQLIVIDGVETTPVRGKLLLTTVSLHSIRVVDAVSGWINPSISIISRSVIVPSGESDEAVQRRTTEQMEESQLLAAAAALELLGYDVRVQPSGVRVQSVAQDAPAAGVLRSGDLILEADGKPVRSTDELVAQVRSHDVGQEIGLELERDGETLDVKVRTVGRPQDPSDPIIGIVIETVPQVELPLAVEIDSRGIGGPSAGLMFAIGVVDLVDARDLARGRVVAGTGEIRLGGEVGPVGAIRQKVESARRAGAELFIVPAPELGDACSVADGLAIVGVETLADAVSQLEAEAIPPERLCPGR